jgi:hypothetical protein
MTAPTSLLHHFTWNVSNPNGPIIDYPLDNIKDLVIQCLRAIQGTKDAGNRWYALLCKTVLDLGLLHTTIHHGVFTWNYNNKPSILILETDDILMASKSITPFLHLQASLSTFFDLTISQGSTLKFLSIHIIQSPCGVSFDQTKHIKSQILDSYFKNTSSTSIPHKAYPFPLEGHFEQLLFEAPPLTDIDLQCVEEKYGTSFNHQVGKLMHITTISRPDLSYACMRFSGYMACPNEPIFSALHHCLCYLYHHPHLPIMYPNKWISTSGGSMHPFWSKGHAEYLSPDFGDDLTAFTDADHAHCLHTHHSVLVYFILHNSVIVSWGFKKQPIW